MPLDDWETRTDRDLSGLRMRWSAWDIHQLTGILIAVPRGTVLIKNMFPEGLEEKLQEWEHENGRREP